MENPQPPPQNKAPQVSQGYWYVVSVLLLVVIGSLAYLWFAERNARVGYQAQAARLATANDSMAAFFAKGFSAGAAPAQTEEKSAKEATIDGQRRSVIEIDEPVGRRLGFAGGDVIVVKKAATTSATAPGGDSR